MKAVVEERYNDAGNYCLLIFQLFQSFSDFCFMLLSLCFPCMMYEDPVMSPSNIRGTFYKNNLNKIHYFSFKFHISFVDYYISFTCLILLLLHLMFLMQQLQHCGGTNLINIGRVKTSRKGVKLVLYYKFTPNIALLKNVDNFHFVAGPEILNSTQSYILDIIDSRCSSSYIYAEIVCEYLYRIEH